MTGRDRTTQDSAPPATVDPLGEALGEALARVLRPLIRHEMIEAIAEIEAARQPQATLKTVDQTCAALQTSRATLHKLRQQGLPTIMLLDSPRFDIEACVEWIRQRSPAQQINSDRCDASVNERASTPPLRLARRGGR